MGSLPFPACLEGELVKIVMGYPVLGVGMDRRQWQKKRAWVGPVSDVQGWGLCYLALSQSELGVKCELGKI